MEGGGGRQVRARAGAPRGTWPVAQLLAPGTRRLYRKGRRRTADGTYVGEFIDGQPTGKGRMDYVGGQSYLGEWEVRCRRRRRRHILTRTRPPGRTLPRLWGPHIPGRQL